jgi:thioredoxin-dependent peroxiredoxin
MLDVGATAPEFESESFDGNKVRLRDLRGSPVVLYFFPKAFTPICTVETRRFRDNYPDLRALGAEVIGVSTDTLAVQCDFAQRQEVRFPMLADPDRRISAAYGVLWPLVPRARRVTFVIGETGLIELVSWHEFQVSKHLDEVLRHLQKRTPGAARARAGAV